MDHKSAEQAEPIVHDCFEPQTATWQYVVADPATKAAIIIDSVLDFDAAKSTVSTKSADALLSLVQEQGYKVEKLVETHAHADHLTASKYLQSKLQGLQGQKPDICIGKRIAEVQATFARKYNIAPEECQGAFDRLFDDDEAFNIGQLAATAMHLPGHTPDHMGYAIGANVFCGDSLFNADVGSARCDFPGGSAPALFASAARLLALPPHFKIWTGHDYPPATREGGAQPRPYMTVAEQRAGNKHLKAGVTEAEFVNWRTERDSSLATPRLMHQALQVNVRAGRLPGAAGEGGERFLLVPIKVEGPEW